MAVETRLPHVYALAGRTDLPYTLAGNPLLDGWVRFLPGERVEIRTGKVELGQGILTAIAQIAADELDVDTARIVMLPTTTGLSPNEGSTTGSRSIQESGMAVRQACAGIRALLLEAAAKDMNVPVESLFVDDGTVRSRASNSTRTYWQVAPAADLGASATAVRATPKAVAALTRAGRSAPRIDLPDRLGAGGFIQDIDLPGMLHGRVVRPPSFRARLVGVDPARAERLPGVRAVVRDGRFLGVVAEREEQAIAAAQALAKGCEWSEEADLPDEADLSEFLLHSDSDSETLRDEPPAGEIVSAIPKRTYTRPFLAHASIAPSCALAWWKSDVLEIWSHSQAVYSLRDEIAEVLERPAATVVVTHAPGAGCYGHNGADDVAFDAVLLAAAVKGRPVRLQWMREDEFAWEPLGPAMMVEITGGLAPSGTVGSWEQHIRGNRHIARPGRLSAPALLAAWHVEGGSAQPDAVDMPVAMGGGGHRNAVPGYDLAGMRVVNHALNAMPLRTSALRALGSHLNVFAIESFMDELAASAGVDPLAFRLRHLTDPRSRAVLERAAAMADWPNPPKGEGVGRGIAFARYKNISTYAAAVIDVRVTDTVRVLTVHAAVDCGRVINPDGALNQCEGGIVQAISWTLKERMTFDRTRITSRNWQSYPILRFSEVPDIHVELIDRPDEEPLGVGEGLTGPTAGAIGNAVSSALGVRVRDLPLTPDNIVRAMD